MKFPNIPASAGRNAICGLAIFFGVALLSWGATVPAYAQSSGGEIPVGLAPEGAPELVESGNENKPTGRQIKAFVFGDSLGDGIAYGLNQAFKGDKSVKIVRMSRASTGFVRDDFYNWNAALPAILQKEEMDIAIVMIGSNDRQTMRLPGAGQKFGTPEFLKNYTERVDRFMKAFSGRGIAVYWLGMPITRGPKHSAAMRVLNGIYRERAEANGITFISTWKRFAGFNGEFVVNGPDAEGTIIRIRGGDGVHFSRLGNRTLATLVEPKIRDLLVAGPVAKGERLIAEPPIDAKVIAGDGEADSVEVQPLDEVAAETDGGAQDLGAGRTQEASSAFTGAQPQAGRSNTQFQDTSPAHTVLTLGGRVAPKPGRGDDFTWQQ